MDVLFFNPHPALKKYIRHYVYCEIGSPDSWTQSSMAPPGCAKLAIVLHTDRILARENGGKARNFPPITYVGQVTHFIPFSWYGRLKVFFVIFHPCGAFPLIGIPQKVCKNLPLNFSNIMNSSARDLNKQITDKDTPEELKRILDRFFLQKISISTKSQEKRRYQSLRLTEVVKIMHASYSTELSIKEVCRQTGYSMSTLERRMKKIVGITPKQLQRIIRLNRAMQFINRNASHLNWPRIARRFGYYDQAHFIKEFKHFNGQTPAEYVAKEPHFLSDISKSKYYKPHIL